MAKTWYPVIDYAACAECGACVEHCAHGVYDKAKAPAPVVKNPGNCVDRCHGCGNICPEGAIAYVGDDTGWTPPRGKPSGEEASSCDCGGETSACACGGAPGKTALVEYLYLDLHTCERCVGTDLELTEVLDTLAPALRLAGYEVEYRKTEMTDADTARRHRFVSSPTIRVNGRDIGGPVRENDCGCCGDIAGTDVDCRVWEAGGEAFEVPPREFLAEEILKALFGGAAANADPGAYALPENLATFYEGKGRCGCGCGGDCG